MKKVSLFLTSIMLLGLTACGPETNERFILQLDGKILDSFGNPKVLTAKNKVDLCAKVTIETFDARGESLSVFDEKVCKDLATEQDGTYTLNTSEQAPADDYKIKSVSFFLQEYDSNAGYYYVVGNGKLDKMSLRMGRDENNEYQIKATVDFDFTDIH